MAGGPLIQLLLLSTCSLLLCAGRSAPAATDELPVPMKILRFGEHLVARHDSNADGRLDAAEAAAAGLPQEADADGDGLLVPRELAGYIVEYGRRRRIRLMPAVEEAQRLPSLLPTGVAAEARAAGSDAREAAEVIPPDMAAPDDPASGEDQRAASRRYVVAPGRLPTGLPAWFVERDLDGDGQLTQAEFSSIASPTAMQQFRACDLNGDGLITPRELVRPARTAKPRSSP